MSKNGKRCADVRQPLIRDRGRAPRDRQDWTVLPQAIAKDFGIYINFLALNE
jgi:hypothetical protein